MSSVKTPFATIEAAIEDIRDGKMVVVCDDENRENEGDLTMAAQFVTPEAVNFMRKEGGGLICLALTAERCDQLGLDLMAAKNESSFETAFTVSVEARSGVSTGISAADRARTIQVAIDPKTSPRELVQPGHVFPLKAKAGGVLERVGQTEAAVDLARLAGLIPAGVICEIMNDDGTMARVPDLVKFCETHNLKMVTVADLIRYRLQNERYIHRVAESLMPTAHGEFRMIAYESEVDGGESHIALVYGHVTGDEPVTVRVHTHCLAGDVFSTTLCDCRAVGENSLRMIAEAGKGALVYLHNGSAGFGLDKGVGAPRGVFHRGRRWREGGEERAHRTLRQVGLGGQLLSDLGIHKIRLLTNTPTHVPALQGFGIEIVEQIPVSTGVGRR